MGLVYRWMAALSVRDQRAVKILAAFVCAVTLWLGIWQPISEYKSRSMAAYLTARADYHWIKEHSVEAILVKSDQMSTEPLLAVVTNAAKPLQILISHAEPQEDSKLRIKIDNVTFEQVLYLLEALQRNNSIKVLNANISKMQNDTGKVYTTFLLK